MANYTLAIVAHMDRREQLERLRAQVHPDIVEVDDGTWGVTGNHAIALAAAYRNARNSGHEWVVILEDDALPVSGFNRQLSAALAAAPTPIVSFYNGTGHPANRQGRFAELSARQDIHWIVHTRMRHAVAYALHSEASGLGACDAVMEAVRDKWAPDDALTRFARRHGFEVAYSNPSLVDHEDGAPMIKSRTSMGIPMIGRRRPRKAHWVGTRMVWGGVDNVGQV